MVPGQELRLLWTETYFWVIPGIFLTPYPGAWHIAGNEYKSLLTDTLHESSEHLPGE